MSLPNIETVNYCLAWGNGQGRGTYIIIRRADDKTTLRNTGSEAVEEFHKLHKVFKSNRARFDALCAEMDFS